MSFTGILLNFYNYHNFLQGGGGGRFPLALVFYFSFGKQNEELQRQHVEYPFPNTFEVNIEPIYNNATQSFYLNLICEYSIIVYRPTCISNI